MESKVEAQIGVHSHSNMVSVAVPADEDWVALATADDQLFYTNYCGYWMRGMEMDTKLGWLVFEHGGCKRAPRETPRAIKRAWKKGEKLPEGWLRIDRKVALRAQAYGVAGFGVEWYRDGDSTRYDYVMQMALFEEERYG